MDFQDTHVVSVSMVSNVIHDVTLPCLWLMQSLFADLSARAYCSQRYVHDLALNCAFII